MKQILIEIVSVLGDVSVQDHRLRVTVESLMVEQMWSRF